MVRGAFWFFGGIAVTLFSYLAAVHSLLGEQYVIAWGAVVFGAVRFFKGRAAAAVYPSYTAISQSDLIKMPPFQATVKRCDNGNVATGGNLIDGNWIAGYFTAAAGRRVCIGGPSASAEMIAFIRSLHKGQTCTLPDAFISFQKSHAGKKP